MTKIHWALFIAGHSLLFALGCGGSDSKKSTTVPEPTAPGSVTPNPGTPGNTGGSGTALDQPANCEKAWFEYVRTHPKGLLTGYKTTSQTTGIPGASLPPTITSYEELVAESDDVHVLTTRTNIVPGSAQPVTTSYAVKKDEWLKTCTTTGPIPIDAKLEILEKSAQTITVTAGTFLTNYIKGKGSDAASKSVTLFQSWITQDGSALLIKTIIETNLEVNGIQVVSSSVTELVKLVNPPATKK